MVTVKCIYLILLAAAIFWSDYHDLKEALRSILDDEACAWIAVRTSTVGCDFPLTPLMRHANDCLLYVPSRGKWFLNRHNFFGSSHGWPESIFHLKLWGSTLVLSVQDLGNLGFV